jgi:hypothetical protein
MFVLSVNLKLVIPIRPEKSHIFRATILYIVQLILSVNTVQANLPHIGKIFPFRSCNFVATAAHAPEIYTSISIYYLIYVAEI